MEDYYERSVRLLTEAIVAYKRGDLQTASDKATEAKKRSWPLDAHDDPKAVYLRSKDLLRTIGRDIKHPHPSWLRRQWWRFDGSATHKVRAICSDVIQA